MPNLTSVIVHETPTIRSIKFWILVIILSIIVNFLFTMHVLSYAYCSFS